MRGKVIFLNNLRVHGRNPYIAAVIHGGPGAAGNMLCVAKRLSEESGILEPLQTKKTISELINELKTSIIMKCNNPIILIGHSWGSWLSLIFSTEHPDLVRKIVLVGCPPFKQTYAEEIMKNRLDRLSSGEKKTMISLLKTFNNSNDSTSDSILLKLFNKTDSYEPVFENNETEFNKEIYKSIWDEASELRKSGKLLHIIEKVKCPLTFIHGVYDPHPLDGVINPLNEKVNEYILYILEKCGHTPWNEKYARSDFFDILFKEINFTRF